MRKNGFTLVELVIVIILIGILASVALPRIFQSVDSAHMAAVEGFASGFNSGLTSFKGDYAVHGKGANTYILSGVAFPVAPSIGLPRVPTDGGAEYCISLAQVLGGLSGGASGFLRGYSILSGSKETTIMEALSTQDMTLEDFNTLIANLVAGAILPEGGYKYAVYYGTTGQTYSIAGATATAQTGCFYYYLGKPGLGQVIYYNDLLMPTPVAILTVVAPGGAGL